MSQSIHTIRGVKYTDETETELTECADSEAVVFGIYRYISTAELESLPEESLRVHQAHRGKRLDIKATCKTRPDAVALARKLGLKLEIGPLHTIRPMRETARDISNEVPYAEAEFFALFRYEDSQYEGQPPLTFPVKDFPTYADAHRFAYDNAIALEPICEHVPLRVLSI